MKHIVAFCTLGLLIITSAGKPFAQTSRQIQDYIERYRSLAMSEQQRTGIPAAIKLAQGIHETGAGTSILARNANNHFGLKCKRGWTGETYTYSDDRPNECFRKYAIDFESYQDQSDYLKSNPRYAALFQLSVTDYAAWAMELRKAGYATNPRYAQELIKLVETYRLQQYTYMAMGNKEYKSPTVAQNSASSSQSSTRNNRLWGRQKTTPANNSPRYREPQTAYAEPAATTPATTTQDYGYGRRTQSRYSYQNQPQRTTQPAPQKKGGTVVKVNNLKAVYGKKGEMPLQYAVAHNVRYQKFLEMNDLQDAPLPADMPLYLERKHFWGIRPMHLVKPYETMLVIAQKEGIQLKYLRDLNYLEVGEEPMPGITLELQAQAAEKPRVADQGTKQVVVKKGMVKNPMQRTPDDGPTWLKKMIPKKNNPAQQKPSYQNTTAKTNTPPVQSKPTQNNSVSDRIINDVQNSSQYQNATYGSNDSYEESAKATTQSTSQYNNPRYVDPNAAKTISTPPTATVPPKSAKELRQEAKLEKRRAKLEAEQRALAAKQMGSRPVQAQPVQQQVQQKPKSELEQLTDQFDNVIYANGNQSRQQTQPAKQQEYRDPSKYYTVRGGDTAYTIAKKHGITVRQLMDWNGLDFDAIKPGQSLRIKQ